MNFYVGRPYAAFELMSPIGIVLIILYLGLDELAFDGDV